MGNCRGVTLVQLIVAIIMIVILSIIAFVYSKNVVTEANIVKVYSEITAVKEGVENTLVLTQVNPEKYKFNELFDDVSAYKGHFEAKLGNISLPNVFYIVSSGNDSLGFSDNTINYELDDILREYVVVLDAERTAVEEIYLVDGVVSNDQNKVYSYTDISYLYDANK